MKKQQISRRQFLKGTAGSAAGLVAAGLLSGCGPSESGEMAYIPGTYTGTAQGMGDVSVTMTFSETSITEVVIDTSQETPQIGGAAASTLHDALMAAQGSEIDVVSGATVTSNAVRKAAASCVNQALGVAEENAPVVEDLSNPYPSCEDLHELNAATRFGEIAFIADRITNYVRTETIDVLVCGQGPAGMASALACSERGLNVVAVEKGSSPTWRSATMGAFKDRIHQKFGVNFDMKQWMDDAMINSSYRGSQAVYQTYVNTTDEAVNWFLDKLGRSDDEYVLTFQASGFPEFTDAYDTLSLSRSWNTSLNVPMEPAEIASTMQQRLSEAGVPVLFNTPVVQLVKDGERVTGAVVQTAEGYVKYETAKGVVLATGGYEFNPKKLNECCRPRDLALGGWMNGTVTNTGDGHEMAKSIGAMEDEYPHPLMLDPGQLMPFLRVNKNGKRFTAEYEAYNHLSNAIQSQPGAFDFYIVDANCSDIVDKIWTPSSGCYGPKFVWVNAAMSEHALVADTLEELSDKMGVDRQAFVATIERWNEMCSLGEDSDFHVPSHMMHPINTAPFYATKEMVEALCTAGGLQITEKSEVMDTNADAIPGLYAIGNVSGSMFSGTYPHNQNCLSHSRCVTFGYNVAKTLSAI